MDKTQRPSLYAILDLVRQRPSMYVGWTDAERDKQLAGLEMLIAGYTLAIHQHGISDEGCDSYARFPDYLQVRFGWSMSCGPLFAIREASRTAAAAPQETSSLISCGSVPVPRMTDDSRRAARLINRRPRDELCRA